MPLLDRSGSSCHAHVDRFRMRPANQQEIQARNAECVCCMSMNVNAGKSDVYISSLRICGVVPFVHILSPLLIIVYRILSRLKIED